MRKISYAVNAATNNERRIKPVDYPDGVYNGTYIYSTYTNRSIGSVWGFKNW